MTDLRFAHIYGVLIGAHCMASIALAAPDTRGISRSVEELRSRQATGYEGGMTPADLALAQRLADEAFATGVPVKACEPGQDSDRVAGKPRSVRGAAGPRVANQTVDVLERFIKEGNSKQRDIAWLALARIGPGSGLGAALVDGPGAWSRMGLSAVTCQRWSDPDVHGMWSVERAHKLSRLGSREKSALVVELMIEQMLDKTLVWPDGVFVETLEISGYVRELTAKRLLRLLPVLTDEAYPVSIRQQAIHFMTSAHGDVRPFEAALLALLGSGIEELSLPAGAALVKLGSVHAADALAHMVESKDYRADLGWWTADADCAYPPASERLVLALVKRLDDQDRNVRNSAIWTLGCLSEAAAIPPLLRMLETSSWSRQQFALDVLARMKALPSDAMAEIVRISTTHWSLVVRQAALRVRDAIEEGRRDQVVRTRHEDARFFHRASIEHGLPICHGKQPADGRYELPWLDPFEVRWEEAKVHDLPRGFPIALEQMRERADYGTNTFLRTGGGWLFGTDLWHYGGELGFVSDGGGVQRFAPRSANAAFIIETGLGTTVLGQDFGEYAGGALAVLDRGPDGSWAYRPLLELPSEAFGYSFAPDGTLLIKDLHGAVAITKELKIIPLECD